MSKKRHSSEPIPREVFKHLIQLFKDRAKTNARQSRKHWAKGEVSNWAFYQGASTASKSCAAALADALIRF
jgi:hypothetical protein